MCSSIYRNSPSETVARNESASASSFSLCSQEVQAEVLRSERAVRVDNKVQRSPIAALLTWSCSTERLRHLDRVTKHKAVSC